MATQITLPKDAEGREVPLDTEMLYDEYGEQRRIAKFIYHHDSETDAAGWTVEYDTGIERFVSLLYITQPDSWEKLEEDLARAITADNVCVYANKGGSCENCVLRDPNTLHLHFCSTNAFRHIRKRILKLRGED